MVGGFENRFAKGPPKVKVPVLVITPFPGEGSAEDEAFWLQVGPCADAVVEFVNSLR